jgi:hypothetical protein
VVSERNIPDPDPNFRKIRSGSALEHKEKKKERKKER